MRFKLGDSVIKLTGGNKMKIIGYDKSYVNCAWFSENYNEELFNEEDLISIKDYICTLINHKRDDFINQILD